MILITGATGKTGGDAARQLAKAGIPFRALIRSPEKAGPIEALGAKISIGDAANPDDLRRAMTGIERAFLVMPNEEEQFELEKQFVEVAADSGVRHIVYLSSLESIPESTNPITRNHVATENFLRASNLEWTLVRPTFFSQNFDGMAGRIKSENKIVLPCGNGTVAPTDVRDVGEIIRLALTEEGHAGKSYDLTGPELLTFNEIAAQFSEVLGREIHYIDQPLEEFEGVLLNINLTPWRVDAVLLEFVAIANGAVDHTTDTIEQLLGRPPRSLRDYLEEFRALFN